MSGALAPTATYRLQLHGKWGFAEARGIVDYLCELGIEYVYTSPIFTARAGSTHGYDAVDPRRISDELGGEIEFDRLVAELRRHEMKLLLDIVPNHMAVDAANPMWMDVLSHGAASQYASWFDITWPCDGGPIALPILGKPLKEVLQAGEIALDFADGAWRMRYYEAAFPIEPGCWSDIFKRASQGDARVGDEQLREALTSLAAVEVPDWRELSQSEHEARRKAAEGLRSALDAELKQHPRLGGVIAEALRNTSVQELHDAQPYRLCHWREATQSVSYRRFFDITHLIGVRVEEPEVFDQTHERLLQLVRSGDVAGLRVDHIDGLADPLQYLRRLDDACGKPTPYILVEKILASDEVLDERWPVAGTTGYECISVISGAGVDRQGLRMLGEYQSVLLGSEQSMNDLIVSKKQQAATELFAGELSALVERAERIITQLLAEQPDRSELRTAITELSAHLPAYRTYITKEDVMRCKVCERDRIMIERAYAAATVQKGNSDALALLRSMLLLEPGIDIGANALNQLAQFILKWQQFTGPLAAKGVEDTALYCEARLVALNEVGADAQSIEAPGGIAALHQHNAFIAEHWPLAMRASTTHDTKRSEDVRARLLVLSELAEDWMDTTKRWREENAAHRNMIDGEEVPDPHWENFLYQNIVGAWPLEREPDAVFTERMVHYAVKASRESKKHTSWIDVNAQYEEAIQHFVRSILSAEATSRWREEAHRFVERIAFAGAINALSALVLKIASPGVPDFYQGSELWENSLVDPDNRRPVDYVRRRRFLSENAAMAESPTESALHDLLCTWRDGRIKMYVTQRGLQLRGAMRELFVQGEYLPIQVGGFLNNHVVAFARQSREQWIIAITPLRVLHLLEASGKPIPERSWQGTCVELPESAPTRLRDALTGKVFAIKDRRLPVADVLRFMPVALLHAV